jgi:hypothetical protein
MDVKFGRRFLCRSSSRTTAMMALMADEFSVLEDTRLGLPHTARVKSGRWRHVLRRSVFPQRADITNQSLI